MAQSALRDRILLTLNKSDRPLSINEIAKKLEVHESTVRQSNGNVWELVEDGIIEERVVISKSDLWCKGFYPVGKPQEVKLRIYDIPPLEVISQNFDSKRTYYQLRGSSLSNSRHFLIDDAPLNTPARLCFYGFAQLYGDYTNPKKAEFKVTPLGTEANQYIKVLRLQSQNRTPFYSFSTLNLKGIAIHGR